MLEPYSSEILWMVILAFVFAFILSFAIGANDVANSFGTSVGSGVITFKQACILATIFEISGAVLLGYKVADTMRKGVLDTKTYIGDEDVFVFGMISALLGSFVWILIATYFRLPVSTTHSIVGSTVGFSLVARGLDGLNLWALGGIVLSWFVSPVLSGVVGIIIYTVIKQLILNASNPFKAGLISLPIIYGITVFVNILSITLGGSPLLYLDKTPIWMSFAISVGAMLLVAAIVQLFAVPWQRKKILASSDFDSKLPSKNSIDIESKIGGSVTTVSTVHVSNDSVTEPVVKTYEDEKVTKLFHFLQTLTAIFTSFTHGGNDVSNSIAPLIAIWKIYTEGNVIQKTESPIFLLFYGGVGMVIGLWILGRRVNETIGKKITRITPVNGFTIESSAATTVLIASKIGVPVSTTHCIVGSVVFVGWVYGDKDGKKRSVDWSLFRSIFFAWIVTLPVAGAISALSMWIYILVK